MEELIRAITLAVRAHSQQTRKYTGEPYIVHPLNVAAMIAYYYKDDTPRYVLAAAVLHDVIEDTGVTEVYLRNHFDSRIVDLVVELTDICSYEDGNRATRKQIERERLFEASDWAQTIKCADLIDNTISIKEYDKDFYKVYQKEARLLLEGMTKADRRLRQQAFDMIRDGEDKEECSGVGGQTHEDIQA